MFLLYGWPGQLLNGKMVGPGFESNKKATPSVGGGFQKI